MLNMHMQRIYGDERVRFVSFFFSDSLIHVDKGENEIVIAQLQVWNIYLCIDNEFKPFM